MSTHPPARIVYDLGGRFGSLACAVAINGDVPAGRSHANFTVLADGRRVAEALGVRAGDPPRPLVADLGGARVLELGVSTSEWPWCHAVWLEPSLAPAADGRPPEARTVTDPLRRADIVVPAAVRAAERCIVTVVSAGFEQWADDLLGSVCAYGNCPDALLVLFGLGREPSFAKLAAKYGAVLVRCDPRVRPNPNSKAVLYAAAHVVPAERFVCLDADTLVLDDLGPLFGAIDVCPPGSILVCGEGNDHGLADLGTALDLAYGGGAVPFLDRSGPLPRYPLVVNDGVFAGSRHALLALDAEIRAMPDAARWVDARPDIPWRNQFVFNTAVARLGAAVEVDPVWNVQLHVQDVEVAGTPVRPRATWRGSDVRVLHFSGIGKHKLADLRARLRAVADPVVGEGSGDAYGAFLRALRCWTGRHGLAGLRWSFHGLRDGSSGRVGDPHAFPPLAALHHLLLANGCVRVLETGTAYGISTGCIAAAVSHRTGGGVVTFDPDPQEECTGFWSLLPQPMARGIELRRTDALAGMREALARRERFHAALLDSDHAADHVWAEFQLATRLVVEGGLILIHDVHLPAGGVGAALERIEAAGYGVTRLFTPGDGVAEDDGLGLAVVENCRRAPAVVTSSGDAPAVLLPPADLGRLRARPWAGQAVPEEALVVPSMLSGREQSLLHWLTRRWFSGVGRIVDGGSFLGGSTAALASGLAARADARWPGVIASYDLFRVEAYTLEHFGAHLPDPVVGASFRPAFDRFVAPWATHLDVREGDVCEIGWSGEPIEILFLDVVKTWRINDVVLSQFLPCLIPGRSVIVQQDYLWSYGPWTHITMELMADSVEILDAMPNGSVAYLLTAPPPPSLVGLRLRDDLTPEELTRLMDRAVDRWSGEERGMVELARVTLLAELAGPAAAQEEFRSVMERHAGSERVRSCAALMSVLPSSVVGEAACT